MKKLFISIILLYTTHLFSEEPSIQLDQDFALLQEAIEIVASMSDNIANIVIQNKTELGTPEMTKQECVALVQKMTAFVLTILKKQKLKKMTRKISICSLENLDQEFENIAENIFYKIKMD